MTSKRKKKRSRFRWLEGDNNWRLETTSIPTYKFTDELKQWFINNCFRFYMWVWFVATVSVFYIYHSSVFIAALQIFLQPVWKVLSNAQFYFSKTNRFWEKNSWKSKKTWNSELSMWKIIYFFRLWFVIIFEWRLSCATTCTDPALLDFQ